MDKNEQKESEDLNLNFLDPNNLQNIIDNVKFCLDRSAKLVILQLSYDKPTHINNNLASVKFFYDYIKMKLEQNSVFVPTTLIPNFEEKLENDFYPDNSLIILEN